MNVVTLKNHQGATARITDFGATLMSLQVADARGHFDDVVLGFKSPQEYGADHPYFGATIGRYANRIAKGQLRIGGRPLQLATNNGPNHLHGGRQGFGKRLWTYTVNDAPQGPAVTLAYTSPDGEEGYPGTLTAQVTYTLTHDNILHLSYEARTDQETIVNLTNHSYFNLKGEGNGTVLDHVLAVDAQHFTPVDASLIPCGRLAPVRGTPFDFTTPQRIGARLRTADEQLRLAHGYDHNFVLSPAQGRLRFAAALWEPTSGRTLDLWTTEPGMQLYTGNFLAGNTRGKSGRPYGRHAGVCLETQHFPNSPNVPLFPSVTLKPGQVYRQATAFKFGARST